MLTLLTALSLIGFTAATLTITDDDGNVPLESRMVFAGLSAVYVLFFNFCKDMNDPFDGVYQIKRSSAASYLLQIKWLIANQPFGKDIKFDTRGLVPVYDTTQDSTITTKTTPPDETKKVEASSTVTSPKPTNTVTVVDAPKETAAAGAHNGERLHQLQEELARLKQLHQQASSSTVGKEGSAADFLPERKKP